MHLTTRLLALLVPMILLLGGKDSNAEPPRPVPSSEVVIERFEIRKDSAELLLPVELKGATYLFGLDTGASGSVYDTSLVSKLGKPIRWAEVRGADGIKRVWLYKSPDAKLGKLSLATEAPVAAIDLRHVREVSGEKIYGIIGMDFLAQHVFRVDPDLGEVVFLKATGPDPGRRLPVKFLGGGSSRRGLRCGSGRAGIVPRGYGIDGLLQRRHAARGVRHSLTTGQTESGG